MGERIISLSWAEIDAVMDFLDRGLSAQGFPTILRLRTQMVVEEMFSAALAAPGAEEGKLRCCLPAPRTVQVQFRSARAGFAPDWSGVKALADNGSSTYGLKLTDNQDGWTILVGEK